MTVKDFALAVCDPKELRVFLSGTEYNLISDYTGKVDSILLGVFGDYIIDVFSSNELGKYNIWIKEVPVKKEAT